MTFQQLTQALPCHRHQIHRSRHGPSGPGHHQLVCVKLGLVEILFHLARDAHLGPRHDGSIGLGAVDKEAVGGGRIAVPLLILNEEALVEAAHHLGHHAAGGIGLLRFKLAGRHQRAAGAWALNGGHRHQAVHRADEGGRLGAIAGAIAAATQATGVIFRGGHIFLRRIEGGGGISPACGDGGLAAQGHVQGRDVARHPGRTRIHPHLAEAVDYLAAAIEHQGIVTVEHQVAAGAVGLGQDLAAGGGVGQHQARARGQCALQRQAVGGGFAERFAVGVERQPVLGEIDGVAAEVAQLHRLVVARAFQVFADEQLCLYLSRQRQPDGQRYQRVSS